MLVASEFARRIYGKATGRLARKDLPMTDDTDEVSPAEMAEIQRKIAAVIASADEVIRLVDEAEDDPDDPEPNDEPEPHPIIYMEDLGPEYGGPP
jgi:hypothetical protein